MTKLEIVDSGVAQMTKLDKLLYRREVARTRSNDQDRYTYDPVHAIFAVADGVGGEPYGAEAAQAACRAFYDELCASDHVFNSETAALVIAETSLAKIIHDAAQETTGFTTFTGMYRLTDTQFAYLHAGDSALLLRRKGDIHHITTEQNQQGNVLTNYIGGYFQMEATQLTSAANMAHQHFTEWGVLDIQKGDRYMLVTDGVSSPTFRYEVTDEWWRHCTSRKIGAQALANLLVRVSPRPDDSTAIVVDF